MSEKEFQSLEELRRSLAEKRLSLRDNLVAMERLAEERFLETMDRVQDQILNTSENLGRTMTRPFQIVEEKLAIIPNRLRAKPIETLLLATCVGASIGLMLGQRSKRKRGAPLSLAPGAMTGAEKILVYSPSAQTAPRGFWVTVMSDVVQQVIMTSVLNAMRRRDRRSSS